MSLHHATYCIDEALLNRVVLRAFEIGPAKFTLDETTQHNLGFRVTRSQ